jgi:hypothetical protein
MHPLIIIRGDRQRDLAKRQVDELAEDWTVRFSPPKRTDDANARMWAQLHDLAEQVEWHGVHLTAEEWKDVMTAGLKRLRVVPGIDGGFVVVGASTSRMSRAEFADLLALISAFGDQNGVKWSDNERCVR